MGSLTENEPVGYTCPDINAVIKKCDGIYSVLSAINEKLNSDTISEILSELSDIYDGSHSDLEKLRSANQELRSWGSEGQKNIATLEDRISNLDREIEDLTEQVDQLETELNNLKDERE